ncbi:MAG: ABC transporter ATP-binding protein, partial [Victivallaceae bacterium]
MTTIELCSITKSYSGALPVLKSVDLKIRAGELFFLLGPSGCGKSTLLRIIAGLLEPDAGKIVFDGEDVTKVKAEKRNAVMMFQSYALWPHMNVFDNVAFGLKIGKVKGDELKNKVNAALKAVQMSEYAARFPAQLSGGQQQRVALARALAVKPTVLLLDEPLSNFDARMRDQVRDEIRRICKDNNLTAIYVTHDCKEALSVADRIAVMRGGVLEQVGTPREIYRHPRNAFVAEFIGNAFIFEVECIAYEAGNNKLRAASQYGEIMISPAADSDTSKFIAGRKFSAMFRPEDVRFGQAEIALGEPGCE